MLRVTDPSLSQTQSQDEDYVPSARSSSQLSSSSSLEPMSQPWPSSLLSSPLSSSPMPSPSSPKSQPVIGSAPDYSAYCSLVDMVHSFEVHLSSFNHLWVLICLCLFALPLSVFFSHYFIGNSLLT